MALALLAFQFLHICPYMCVFLHVCVRTCMSYMFGGRYEGYEDHFPLEAQGRWYNWPSAEYDSLTLADVAASLTQVYPYMSALICVCSYMSALLCVCSYMSALICVCSYMSALLCVCSYMSALMCVCSYMSALI